MGVPWGEGLKRMSGGIAGDFFFGNFGRDIVGTFTAKRNVIMQHRGVFLVTIKWLTLNDLEMPFILKSFSSSTLFFALLSETAV